MRRLVEVTLLLSSASGKRSMSSTLAAMVWLPATSSSEKMKTFVRNRSFASRISATMGASIDQMRRYATLLDGKRVHPDTQLWVCTNVVVEAITPAFMEVSDTATSPAGGCLHYLSCGAGQLLQWSLGTLAPGEVRVVRLAVTEKASSMMARSARAPVP